MNQFRVRGKNYKLPIFLPDATKAVTKSIDSIDLNTSKVRGAVVNTYHLQTNPGIEVLTRVGGIKNFMNFKGLIVSDSGGWQVFSLIHRNNSGGKITDEGVIFRIGGGKKELFTPEQSIAVQFDIGSDIIICLDDFSPPKASFEKTLESVNRTTLWAKRSKQEYERQLKKRKTSPSQRPLLFSVIQGGTFKELRTKSANELIEIGFDGYGYGGYVIDAYGQLDLALSKFIVKLIPEDKIKFALGVGRLADIYHLAKMGWEIFDCTLPTRDARHKRLYTFLKPVDKLNEKSFSYIYINKVKHATEFEPISDFCDCYTCKHFTKAYLHHLFKIKDTLAFRLATIHNLRTYTLLTETIFQES